MAYEGEVTTNGSSVAKLDHRPVLTVVPVWEGTAVYPGADVLLDSRDYGGSKGVIRNSSRCPDLPVWEGKNR